MSENFIADNGNASFLKASLLSLAENGSIDLEDVREMYFQMEKEIILSKYKFPTKTSSDGYYHLNVKDASKANGRGQLKARTIEELKQKAYNFEKGIHGKAEKTFQDVFDIVQSEKLRYTKNDEKRLSVLNTLGRNHSEYTRFFGSTAFEKKFIAEITKKDVEEITLLNLQRYDLTNKAFLSYRGILKAVFQLAYEEYWIADNLYTRINFAKYKDMLVRPTPINKRVHSDNEIETIREFLKQKQSKDYLPAYAMELQMLMGLRRGEVLALKWSDMESGCFLICREQITVNQSAYNNKEFYAIVEHTKTWKDRKFPITAEIQNLLDRLLAVHKRKHIKSEFLFPANNALGVVSNQALYSFYRRMCQALNIPLNKECIKGTHSFRRNAITQFVNDSGGNMLMASQLYGNTPTVAEKNYYAGLNLSDAKAVLEA